MSKSIARLLWLLPFVVTACESTVTPNRDAATRDVVTDAAVDAQDPIPYAGPDDWCPGRDHCRGTGDNRLQVGVAKENINPPLTERYTDTNRNGTYNEGEPYNDANMNGEFDAAWLAGFGAGRAATGIHDDLEVRAIAFRYNDITVAWAVIDCVGFFINEMDTVRGDPMLRDVDVDKIIISSTHVHEGVDTVGLWGRELGVSGYNRTYQTLVRQKTALAVRRAIETVRPVRMRVAQTVTVDGMGSTLDYVNDVRDPVIFDPTITAVQFVDDAMPTNTVATWINWAAHPEYTGSRNTEVSADYVHWLRDTVEGGIPSEMLPGVGGMTVFFNGALGGQVGPSGAHPRDASGMMISEAGFAKAEAAGKAVGRLALQALARGATEATETAVSYRTAPLNARVENIGYGIYYNSGVFNRELFNWDSRSPLVEGNFAWLRSRVTYLQVGPVAAITAPGELHPELWVGFDERWSWGQTRVSEEANPPDFSRAPRAPFLRDLMLMNPGVRYAVVGGLGEDFLGYIVPEYNYVLSGVLPYITEARGDHYEETNSIGPEVERFIQHPMMDLARWRPPAQ
jgi:hypothetical protein